MYIKRNKGDFKANDTIFLNERIAVALGNFDGLHKGHLELISKVKAYASINNMRSCVFSFTTNLGGAPYITSFEQRVSILRGEQIDCFALCEFTDKFKHLSPEDFFEQYILGLLGASYIAVGFNYRFGHKARGDTALLEALCARHNVSIDIIPPIMCNGEVISSTKIRSYIQAGDLKRTKEMLGRPFSVAGIVERGDCIGKQLGFPTANLPIDKLHIMPPTGVYATPTVFEGKRFTSITNLGAKPTIKESKNMIETHILGFDKDLYGKLIEVEFLEKMRSIKKFASRKELSMRLLSDKKTRLYGKGECKS